MFGLGWKPMSASVFFFFTRLWDLRLLFMYFSINNNRKVWLFSLFQPISAHRVLFTSHKFHFLVIFSLKMGPTVLFTHLKIILLQCFSVSILNFQLYPNGSLEAGNLNKWRIKIWEMLTSALRALVKNPIKEKFYGKKNTINVLTVFFISHKSDIKTFLKWILNQYPKGTR